MKRALSCTLALVVVAILSVPAIAEVKLPSIFSDNMVLQRDMPIHIWGWAQAGEKVAVKLAGQSLETQADDGGNWAVEFKPRKAGGEAIDLTVTGKNTLALKNILVGEVWICSGQSNMEFPLAQARDGAKEVLRSDYPQIRLFTVEKTPSPIPARDLLGRWDVCGPKTSGEFSAVAYFFGLALHKDLKVPVGLIDSSWGATSAEPWTSRERLADIPWLQNTLKEYDAYTRGLSDARTDAQFKEAIAKINDGWIAKHRHADPGNKGFALGYASTDEIDKDWKEIELPQMFQNAGYKYNGAFWVRKTIELPKSAVGQDFQLELGYLDDFDTTYFNGQQVGAVGRDTPNAYSVRRQYQVPGNLVKSGRNVIAVRVFDWGGDGGFNPRSPAGLWLSLLRKPLDKPISVSLTGKWKIKVEKELPYMEFVMPPGTQASPCGLYNGMIAPLTKFPIRGAIWYQGESNSGASVKYRTVFPALIKDWRAQWRQPEMPFMFVQLANFMDRRDQPSESAWAELREAQLMTLALPKTGMAVIIDIGDAADIHPKNKQDVGKRLELAALAQAYGKEIVYSGPIYKSMKVDGDKARLSFDHLGGGLVARGDKLVGFAVAGEDRKFVWADAVIDGETVVVSSKQVATPKSVRYAWVDNPDCNLFNKPAARKPGSSPENTATWPVRPDHWLPASPFRTDDWPGVTDKQ